MQRRLGAGVDLLATLNPVSQKLEKESARSLEAGRTLYRGVRPLCSESAAAAHSCLHLSACAAVQVKGIPGREIFQTPPNFSSHLQPKEHASPRGSLLHFLSVRRLYLALEVGKQHLPSASLSIANDGLQPPLFVRLSDVISIQPPGTEPSRGLGHEDLCESLPERLLIEFPDASLWYLVDEDDFIGEPPCGTLPLQVG